MYCTRKLVSVLNNMLLQQVSIFCRLIHKTALFSSHFTPASVKGTRATDQYKTTQRHSHGHRAGPSVDSTNAASVASQLWNPTRKRIQGWG